MSEWINVSDRLPEKSGEYLCCVCYGWCGEITRHIENISYSTGCMGDKYWECEEKEFVTHWMPLPELPEIKF